MVGALGTGFVFVGGRSRAKISACLSGVGIVVILMIGVGFTRFGGGLLLPFAAPRPGAVASDALRRRDARLMTRRLLAYAFPFMDSLDPIRLRLTSVATDDTLQMDEETFRGFYTRTSGMVWAYIARATNDPSAADDLLQEAYYRLLRSTTTFESDDHRRNYLFRIATNLIRDRYRRPRLDNAQLPEHGEGDIPAAATWRSRRNSARTCSARWRSCRTASASSCGWPTGRARRIRRLPARSGLKTGSIKPLLFRARRKLARILRS